MSVISNQASHFSVWAADRRSQLRSARYPGEIQKGCVRLAHRSLLPYPLGVHEPERRGSGVKVVLRASLGDPDIGWLFFDAAADGHFYDVRPHGGKCFSFHPNWDMIARTFRLYIKAGSLKVFMIRSLHLALFPVLLLCTAPIAQQDSGSKFSSPSKKPEPAKTEEVVTDYFGAKVSDPYRWMEAGTSEAGLMEFLKSQNDYTRSMLGPLAGRDAMLARIRQLDNAVPVAWQRGGNSIFISRNRLRRSYRFLTGA